MATIQKRKNKNGTASYRVMIRTQDGLPPIYKTFPTHQEAKEWAIQQEALRRQGLYFPEQIKKKHTLADLIDRYIELILSSKPKNARDTLRHLTWWKEKVGSTALNLVTPDLIAKYRKGLLEGITPNGTKRTPATTNRYLAALSVVFSFGVKECGWLSNNPVLRVTNCQYLSSIRAALSITICANDFAFKTTLQSIRLSLVQAAYSLGAKIKGKRWSDFQRSISMVRRIFARRKQLDPSWESL